MTHWHGVIGGTPWSLLVLWGGSAGDLVLGLHLKLQSALIAASVLGSLAPICVFLSSSRGAIGGVIAFAALVSSDAGCLVGATNDFLMKSIVAVDELDGTVSLMMKLIWK